MVLSTENKKNKLIKTHPNKKYKLDNVFNHIFTPKSFLVSPSNIMQSKTANEFNHQKAETLNNSIFCSLCLLFWYNNYIISNK